MNALAHDPTGQSPTCEELLRENLRLRARVEELEYVLALAPHPCRFAAKHRYHLWHRSLRWLVARKRPELVDLEAEIEHLIRVQKATMQQIEATILERAERLRPVDAATAARKVLPVHLK